MATSQEKILQYALKNAVFDGWTDKLLSNACLAAKLDKNHWKIPFPKGPVDVIDYWVDNANNDMTKGLKLEGMKTPEKIRALIINRLEQHKDQKEAIKSAMAVYALHPVEGTQASYRTVNAIWQAAGDTSTDWNFYTKRMTLAGVYWAVLMYWLSDESKDSKDSWKFLDERLKDVAKFGKFTGDLKKKFG